MKWIGQHIWDFISRFRNDVYFEAVPDGTIASGKSLGLDTTNKLVKAAGSSGGTSGSITVKTNGDGDSAISNVRTDVTELIFYGNDDKVKIYDNGPGSVLIDHHASLSFAPSYSSVTTNLSSSTVDRIVGIPGTGNGNLYYPGDWAGTKGRPTTGGNQTIYFNSNSAVSGLANNPGVEVTVYGPQDTSTSGNSNILGEDGSNGYTYLYTVDSTDVNGQTGSARGITVTISSLVPDGVGSALKGEIDVTIDPDHTDLITTNYNGNTYTGSQKFHSVKIRHLDGNGVELGTYTSGSWFHDNNPQAPVSPRPSISLTSDTVSRLSNIAHYSAAEFTVSSSGFTNMFRDTSRYSSMGTGTNPGHYWWRISNQFDDDNSPLFVTDTKTHLKTKNDNITGQSVDLLLTAGENVGSVSNNYDIDDNRWALNHALNVKTKVENDETTSVSWVVDGIYGNSLSDNFRNYNTFTTGLSTALFEGHKTELYRLSGNTEGTWSGLNTAEDEDYWKDMAVGGTSGDVQKSLLLNPYTASAGDYVTLTNDIIPTTTTALTVAGWIKTNDEYSNFNAIFSNNGTTTDTPDGANNLILGMHDMSTGSHFSETSMAQHYWWVAYRHGSGSSDFSYSTNGQVGTATKQEVPAHDSWYHLGFVLKHNANSNTDVLVYVNGALVWEQEHTGEFIIPGATSATRPYSFGLEFDGSNSTGNRLNAYLSEWGIWDSELTLNELNALAYDGGNLRDLRYTVAAYNSQSDLIGYYKFDDDVSNDGGTITDFSGEGNHGLTVNPNTTYGNLSFELDSPWSAPQNNIDYTGHGLNNNNEHLLQGYFNSQWRLIHPSDNDVGTIAALPAHIWSDPGAGTYEYTRFFRHSADADYAKGNIKINGLSKGADSSPASGTFRHQLDAGNLEVHFMIPGSGTGKGVWVPLANDYNPGVTNQGCWMWSADNKQGVSGDYYYDIQMYASFRVLIMRIKFNNSFNGDIKDLTWEANVWKNE